MSNDSTDVSDDDDIMVYTDPDHDPEGQRYIPLVRDAWYPGTCEVRLGSDRTDRLKRLDYNSTHRATSAFIYPHPAYLCGPLTASNSGCLVHVKGLAYDNAKMTVR